MFSEVVKGYVFTRARRASIYPWDEILDGQSRKVHEERLTCKPATFILQSRAAAKKRGLKVTANLESTDGGVYIHLQAYRADADGKPTDGKKAKGK